MSMPMTIADSRVDIINVEEEAWEQGTPRQTGTAPRRGAHGGPTIVPA
jgi:hypothetical protein